MASTAVLLLDFGKQLTITLYDSHIWKVSGDPKGVLAVDGGDWSFAPTVGTQLIAKRHVEIVLVGWKLADLTSGASKGGIAYLFPETANTLGNFKVTSAV